MKIPRTPLVENDHDLFHAATGGLDHIAASADTTIDGVVHSAHVVLQPSYMFGGREVIYPDTLAVSKLKSSLSAEVVYRIEEDVWNVKRKDIELGPGATFFVKVVVTHTSGPLTPPETSRPWTGDASTDITVQYGKDQVDEAPLDLSTPQ